MIYYNRTEKNDKIQRPDFDYFFLIVNVNGDIDEILYYIIPVDAIDPEDWQIFIKNSKVTDHYEDDIRKYTYWKYIKLSDWNVIMDKEKKPFRLFEKHHDPYDTKYDDIFVRDYAYKNVSDTEEQHWDISVLPIFREHTFQVLNYSFCV